MLIAKLLELNVFRIVRLEHFVDQRNEKIRHLLCDGAEHIVKNRAVMAVEAIEGTDACFERTLGRFSVDVYSELFVRADGAVFALLFTGNMLFSM